MAPDDFQFLARLLRRRSGLMLTDGRRVMVEGRLAPVMRRFGFKDIASLVAELRAGRESLAEAVTEIMAVNETSFFRDPAQFGIFRAVLLPRLVAARQTERRLRIWSAAASTGQEAYSIAMTCADLGLARDGWSLDIIATDISSDAIARAEAGRYSAAEIARAPEMDALTRHLRRDGAEWVVAESLRRMVRFRRFNLMDSYGWLDDVDAVFCRNVLMYFDGAARGDVLERIADTMAQGGVLLLGEHETARRACFVSSADGAGIYVKKRALLSSLRA